MYNIIHFESSFVVIVKHCPSWAVVVAQLVEQSLLTPDIHSSNPVNFYLPTANCIKQTKIKKKSH